MRAEAGACAPRVRSQGEANVKHISIRDEKMAAAQRRVNRAEEAYLVAITSRRPKREAAALKKELDAAHAAYDRAARSRDEHYCGPCGATHPVGNHGILVLKRAIAPDGTEFERSHDLHVVLCESEWKRLRIQDLIARQLQHEKE